MRCFSPVLIFHLPTVLCPFEHDSWLLLSSYGEAYSGMGFQSAASVTLLSPSFKKVRSKFSICEPWGQGAWGIRCWGLGDTEGVAALEGHHKGVFVLGMGLGGSKCRVMFQEVCFLSGWNPAVMRKVGMGRRGWYVCVCTCRYIFVCMWMCMYVWIRLCMAVSVYVWICMWACVLRLRVSVCEHMYYMFMSECMCESMYICIQLCVCACTSIYVNICIVCVGALVCTCTCALLLLGSGVNLTQQSPFKVEIRKLRSPSPKPDPCMTDKAFINHFLIFTPSLASPIIT